MSDAAEKSDLLYGAAAIAAHLSMTRRQVYHLAEKAGLPVFRFENTSTAATRSKLATWIAERAAAVLDR